MSDVAARRQSMLSRPSLNLFQVSPFPREGREESRRDSLQGIRSLITADDLSVVFQPIVRVDTLAVFAYEALVRCRKEAFRHPPELFRRAVEEACTGRLGRMIREVAVPLCAGVPCFLNVHPIELQERWLVRPDDPLYFHDAPVYLEVTESVPLLHSDLCHEVLREVRKRGNVHLVVDDLGAGFSNLRHIVDLEPKVVKLDRGLVANVDGNARQRLLVEGLVRLCADLGAEVVAEGVETAAEYQVLRDTGVQYAQGYLFARPAFPLPEVSDEALRLLPPAP